MTRKADGIPPPLVQAQPPRRGGRSWVNPKPKPKGADTMLPIKNILDSLRDDVLSGKITLHEAAEELHENGWTNFIDEDAARRLLKL